jgi:glycosyltransferase involved in cell wall biosynthesis
MVQNVRELFDHAKIVACPSFYEGFSRTPIEGLARGCACICSDIPSHREILDGGRYGVLLDPLDTTRWADAITELLDNNERREVLAREGGEWAGENFAFEPLAERYIRLYEEMKMSSGGDF